MANITNINIDYSIELSLMSMNENTLLKRRMLPGSVFAEIVSCLKYDDPLGNVFRNMCDGAIVRTENKHIRFINGMIDSFIGNPTQVIIYGKNIWLNWKNSNDQFHREDGPSQVHYSDMLLESESWSINGRFHRVGGPAYTSYQNNNVIYDIYIINGEIVEDMNRRRYE